MVELQPADYSDSNTSMCSPLLAIHNDYDGECVEQAVDLNACTPIEYEKKDDAHGVKFICDEKKKNKSTSHHEHHPSFHTTYTCLSEHPNSLAQLPTQEVVIPSIK